MGAPEDLKGLRYSLLAYAVILILKLAVYAATGLLALLAEALHTVSDLLITSVLLLAAHYSRRPADAMHMFGYGRAQNAAALVAAVFFLSFTSLELLREAIPRLTHPAILEVQNLGLALTVLVVSMLIAAAPLVSLLRSKTRGPAARAQLLELANDELGLAAALLGILAVYFGQPLGDPLAAIAVALVIAYNALRLLRENFSLLLGRSPDSATVAGILEAARSVPGVLSVDGLRAEMVAPGVVHAGLRITVARGTPIEAAAETAAAVEHAIHTQLPAGYCFIRTDPAPA